VIAGGVYVLYQALTGGTVSNYTDALSDTKLWSDMTCAIYAAIRADGHVTDGNYGAVLANVRAVTYAHPDVVSAIGDFVAAIGASGMEHAQQVGALNAADCSGCPASGWCYVYAGATINVPAWQPDANLNETAFEVIFSGGAAISTQRGDGYTRLHLYLPFAKPVALTGIRVVGARGATPDDNYTHAVTYAYGVSYPLPTVPGGYDVSFTPTQAATCLEIALDNHTTLNDTITRIELHGTGPNPFGASNC